MPAPVRTAEQRTAALEAAMRTRRFRADLRVALKAGVQDPIVILEAGADHPSYSSLRVRWLLESLPGIGPIRCELLMQELGIAVTRRVGGLNERHRQLLVGALQK
ncbi:MAG: integration host factor, actinobacterial type [Actinomycetota bacterium]|nr:integration host factor, actinobacterial type [Actinomycetota bacterium]